MSPLRQPSTLPHRFAGRFERWIRILAARPGSESGSRGETRVRRAFWSWITNLAAKGVGFGTVLVSIPLTVDYLGTERFGMWMTLSSMIAFLALVNFGIDKSLITMLSGATGRENSDEQRRLISSAYATVSMIAVIGVAILTLCYPFVSWPRVFNVSDPLAIAEAGPAAAVFCVCLLLQQVFGLVTSVQSGYQSAYVSSLWEAIGRLLGLALVLLGIVLEVGLPLLAAAMLCGPILASLGNTFVLFTIQRRDLAPRRAYIDRNAAVSVARTGGKFLLIQGAGVFAVASDNFVITHVIGPHAVAEYSVVRTAFNAISMVVIIALSGLWPAYGEAFARGDWKWVRLVLNRSMVMSPLIVAVASIPMVVFGHTIIDLWVGNKFDVSWTLLYGFFLLNVVFAYGSSFAMYMNGVNMINAQIFIGIGFAIGSLFLKIYLGAVYGIEGVVWAVASSYLLLGVVPTSILWWKAVRMLRKQPQPAG